MNPADEMNLLPDQPMSFEDERGLDVCAVAGTLWITVTGEAGDIFLSRGESFRVGTNGRVVIEALYGPARLRLVRRQPWRRMSSQLQRMAAAIAGWVGSAAGYRRDRRPT